MSSFLYLAASLLTSLTRMRASLMISCTATSLAASTFRRISFSVLEYSLRGQRMRTDGLASVLLYLLRWVAGGGRRNEQQAVVFYAVVTRRKRLRDMSMVAGHPTGVADGMRNLAVALRHDGIRPLKHSSWRTSNEKHGICQK